MASEPKSDSDESFDEQESPPERHEALAILAAQRRVADPERAARMIAPASDVEVKGRTVTL